MSNNEIYKSYLDRALARQVVSARVKAKDARGLNSKKNYSSFWMDDKEDRFGGLSDSSKSNDLVKVIKLANYRRAITNFVKILTNREIPVSFYGADSYTDGKGITISTDIKDNNFDVTVGLALHEASHCVLTDFSLLPNLELNPQVLDLIHKYSDKQPSYVVSKLVKELLNYVEDRRIDHYVFKSCPGYKAYYHKLYDYYWNSKEIAKLFVSKSHRDCTIENYMFHVINSMNPLFNPAALAGLSDIVNILDLRNIDRLNSTSDALSVAAQVADVILANSLSEKEEQEKNEKESQERMERMNAEGDQEGQSGNDPRESEAPENSEVDGDSEGDDEGDDTEELSAKDGNELRKALQKQRNFMNGESDKKAATRKLQRQLQAAQDDVMQVQQVGDMEGVPATNCLMIDFTDSAVSNYIIKSEEYNKLQNDNGTNWRQMNLSDDEYARMLQINRELQNVGIVRDYIGRYPEKRYEAAVNAGLEMGGLLGKKLQLHNEARERVDNRLRSGRIDNRRLAHAGYGIENVFQQIHIDKYKNANLHISLDGSGSMGGDKWKSAITMTIAIAKAADYAQGINVQVSVRCTHTAGREVPTNLLAYDSKKNKIHHLVQFMRHFHPNSMTPEGLCFEGMIKQNLLKSGTAEMDSYFLNISDGAPGMNGYGGWTAAGHTAKQINHMKNTLDMQVLSFYVEHYYGMEGDMASLVEHFHNSGTGKLFKHMYGKDATVVDPNSAIAIAKELNKKFMTKK